MSRPGSTWIIGRSQSGSVSTSTCSIPQPVAGRGGVMRSPLTQSYFQGNASSRMPPRTTQAAHKVMVVLGIVVIAQEGGKIEPSSSRILSREPATRALVLAFGELHHAEDLLPALSRKKQRVTDSWCISRNLQTPGWRARTRATPFSRVRPAPV